MKPGWRTSEFWMALIGQALALLALTGVIPVGDQEQLETALANAVTAVFTILSSAAVVIRYIRSRTDLKSQALTAPPQRPLVLPLVLVAGLLLATPLPAAPPAQPACFGQRQPRTDPALLALVKQLAENQQALLALLHQQRAPAPAQPLILLTPPSIPLGGLPRQDIQLGQPPRQDIPLGGAPRQDIPLGQPPRQEVPLGPAPRQNIPLGEVKPLVPTPGEAKPAPAALQKYLGVSVPRSGRR